MAVAYDIEVDQGATKILTLDCQDDTGAPIILTGYLGRGQVRRKTSSPEVVAEFIVEVTNGPLGKVKVTLSAAATKNIGSLQASSFESINKFPYDIELYTGSPAYVIRLLNGYVLLSPETTREP